VFCNESRCQCHGCNAPRGKQLLKIEKMKLEKDYTKGAFNIRAGFYTAICFEKGCCSHSVKDRLSAGIVKEAAEGSETILLVEDEEAVRTVTSRILSAKGYSVLNAGNASEAINICKRRKEDIAMLITDIRRELLVTMGYRKQAHLFCRNFLLQRRF